MRIREAAATTRRPTVHVTHAARTNMIVEAATELIYRSGEPALNMTDVARAARISRQLLYAHFASADEILDAVVQRCVDGLQLTDLRHASDIVSFASQLQWCVTGLFEDPAREIRIVSTAYHAESADSRASMSARLHERIGTLWIEPLTAMGISREVATLGITSIFLSALQYRELIETGIVSAHAANVQIRRMTSALLCVDASLPVVSLLATSSPVGSPPRNRPGDAVSLGDRIPVGSAGLGDVANVPEGTREPCRRRTPSHLRLVVTPL